MNSLNNSNLINTYLYKLAPSADTDTRFDLVERGKHLNRVRQFTRRLSAVRWGVAKGIVYAWVLTFPICGLIGAGLFEILRLVTK